jgi:hypothetical protein
MTWKNAPINFGFKVLEDEDDFSKKVAGEMLQRVVVATPVDTGQARGNWRVNVGSVDTSTTETTDRSGQGTISKGIATIQAGGGLGKVVYISNSLRYIERLNNGWSMQAPANFV